MFGHAAGDTLLATVARRMQDAIGDTFLARLGGDEFAIVAPAGAHPPKAAALAEKLLAAVVDEIVIDQQHLRVGLSIGVALFPDDGTDPDALTANADAALYRAKADGRGSIRFFEAEMDQQIRKHHAIQLDLRGAIERNELELYFQPQARLQHEIVAFEALLRWHHPVRGFVPPSTFVPLAEESGLIFGIGEWVLREACREAARWSNPLRVSVNLSPVQFRHGDLPSLVHAILLETGLPPARLELEVTEGVLINDFERTVSILRRLKSLGVRVAMDDFGTGYSSLSYLQAFPFDKIKIDQRFICNLEHDAQSATIVRAVIGLAMPNVIAAVARMAPRKGRMRNRSSGTRAASPRRRSMIQNSGSETQASAAAASASHGTSSASIAAKASPPRISAPSTCAGASKARPRGSADSGSTASAKATAAMPMGMTMTKMLRQPACSMSKPPKVGPITKASPLQADQMPMACRRSAGSGQTTATKASDDGNNNAAPMPATTQRVRPATPTEAAMTMLTISAASSTSRKTMIATASMGPQRAIR